jgi:DNA topoisomerase-1
LLKNFDVLTKINEILGKMIFGYDEKGNLKNRCPDCKDGALNIKTGKFGIFIACSNYPTCKHTEQIVEGGADEGRDEGAVGEKFESRILGEIDGKNVYLKKGPYGFYAQLGEDNAKQKPKRVSLKNAKNPDEVVFKDVEYMLSLPKVIGKHPGNGGEIKVNIGPYGPYVMWNKKFFSIKKCDIGDVDVDKALKIIESEGKRKEKGGKSQEKKS